MNEHEKHENAGNRTSLLRESLNVYLEGRSGIQFETLMRFAGPLFDLYDVDWRSGDEGGRRVRDREELSTMVAILDTARLLWTFFSLDDEQRLATLPDLEDAMLGPSAGDEERSNLLVVLSLLEEHWSSFSSEERARAESTPGYTLPEFETLLAEFAESGRRLPKETPERYGPERLDLPEALALFAEPLLRDDFVEANPDLLEERVARAQAYWNLANTPDEFFEDELDRIQESFAASEAEAEDIRREAEQMVRRYNELFSKPNGD